MSVGRDQLSLLPPRRPRTSVTAVAGTRAAPWENETPTDGSECK